MKRAQLNPSTDLQPGPHARPDSTPLAYESGALEDLWKLLWQRKMLICACTLLGVIGGLSMGLIQQPEYRARTAIELEGLNDNYLNLKDLSPTSPAVNYAADAYLQTQVKLIQSDPVALRVAYNLHLSGASIQRRPRWCAIGRRIGIASCLPLSEKEALIQEARSGLSVRSSLDSRQIEITYTASDPAAAALAANVFAKEYIALQVEVRGHSAQENIQWLQSQLANVKTKLAEAEAVMQNQARSTGIIYLSNKDSIIEDNIRKLQLEVVNAQVDRMIKQSRYEIADATPLAVLPENPNSQLTALQTSLIALRREYNAASSKFTAEHPKLRQLREQMDSLEADLVREQSAVRDRIRKEYEAAKRREDLLQVGYKQRMGQLGVQSQQIAQYDNLKHDLAATQQLYDTLLQKLRETEIASALRATNVRVVEPANPPSIPYSPNPKLNGAIGALGAFIAALALVVVRRGTDKRVREPGDSALCLEAPDLGVIPSVNVLSDGNGGLNLAGDRSIELALWNSRPSQLAESFRATVTSIQLRARGPETTQVLVLTSLEPGEGKTTMVSNLAVALAQTGQNVLIVDADLRRPRVDKIFDLDNSRGLADVFDDVIPLNELIKKTHIPGISVLPSGASNPDALPTINQARMKRLFALLQRYYGTILIDCPPASFSETRVLASIATGVILVVRAGRTTSEKLVDCYNQILLDNSNVLGTILNDWRPKSRSGDTVHAYYHVAQ
jgi:succinoglycan biosynthesis transport protein ExoP